MSNNKQSSVEWLDRWFRDNPEATHEEGNAALEQAKAMHKEEQRNTWLESRTEDKGDNYIGSTKSFEQYYNETFGGTP